MRLLFLRLFSVVLACASLVFWLKAVNLFHSQATRRFLLLAGLVVLFFPSLFCDLSRLGNDSLASLLFSAGFYFLLSTVVNEQKRLSDFTGLALVLGLGLLTKVFFLPILLGVILFSLWLGVRVNRLGLRPVLLRISVLVGAPFLVAGWWFLPSYSRYGMIIASQEAYLFKRIVNPPGDALGTGQIVVQWLRAVKGFAGTFLWSGTWSLVFPPPYLFVCFVPLLGFTLWGLMAFARGERKAEMCRILTASLFLLLPLLLPFAYHIYLRIQFTGVGTGPGGYYLFFAWPIIGILFASSFDAKKTIVSKLGLLFALALVSFFEMAGWWSQALVYSGVVVKTGAFNTGFGVFNPTFGNVALVLDRLSLLAFPRGALVLFGTAFVLRSALAVWAIFSFLPPPDVRH